MLTHPIIQYPGAKWRIANDILKYFPSHRTYTEVFGGSGALLLNKKPSFMEIYNDIDGELCNLFKQLQNKESSDIIKHRLSYTPYSRDECNLAFEYTDDKIEAACRLIVRSYLSRSLHTSSFRKPSALSWSSATQAWADYPDMIGDVYGRLKQVIVENIPAIDCLIAYDSPETLHYIDPPYVGHTRSKNLYKNEMQSESEHERLLEYLVSLEGMVILSGYANDLYSDMLDDWTQVYIDARADKGAARVEVLYLSPNIPMNRQSTFL